MERLRMESGGDSQSVSTLSRRTESGEAVHALAEIIVNLSQTLEPDRLLSNVADHLFQLFKQADRCFIILVEEGSDRLLPKVVRTRRLEDEANARWGESLVLRECLKRHQTFLSDEADSGPRPPGGGAVDYRIRSVMCAPLVGPAGTALGAVQLDTRDRTKKFTRDDLTVLHAIAAQVSLALENANLHRSAVATERLKRDVELAGILQASFLPEAMPQVPGYEVAAHFSAARAVSGDYYGFVPLGPGRLAFSVADVAGLGVPAALLMARLCSDVPHCLLGEAELTRAIGKLNDLLCPISGKHDRFITLACGVLDSTSHVVSLVNAGHLTPLLYRASSGSLEDAMPKEVCGLPLGLLAEIALDQTYEAHRLPLAPGDCLLLFSDGLTEEPNDRDQYFGLEGISAALKGKAGLGPRAVVELLVQAVKRHAGGRAQRDDMTLLCVGRLGEGGDRS
jgi:serine phosphatase RsbU (regulator of sigma subunit)